MSKRPVRSKSKKPETVTVCCMCFGDPTMGGDDGLNAMGERPGTTITTAGCRDDEPYCYDCGFDNLKQVPIADVLRVAT